MGQIVVDHAAADVQHVAKQPRQQAGEPLAGLDRHRLHNADQDAHGHVNEIIDDLPAPHGERPFNSEVGSTLSQNGRLGKERFVAARDRWRLSPADAAAQHSAVASAAASGTRSCTYALAAIVALRCRQPVFPGLQHRIASAGAASRPGPSRRPCRWPE